jgi:hypothetical protein
MEYGPVCRAAYLQHNQVALALLELHLLFKSGAKGIKRVSYLSSISTNSLRSRWQYEIVSGTQQPSVEPFVTEPSILGL